MGNSLLNLARRDNLNYLQVGVFLEGGAGGRGGGTLKVKSLRFAEKYVAAGGI